MAEEAETTKKIKEGEKEAAAEGTLPTIVTDPVESAKAAGLRYHADTGPGIGRKRTAKGFRYVGPDGTPIRDPDTLARVRSLGIPPAYTDVWISPDPKGHIQATGRDATGRKQYRYHPKWREMRDETKYSRMIAFGQALPTIRERVDQDLSLRGFPREKVLATIVRLLETTRIRVGNEEYAKTNKSFGLTTLRMRHFDVQGATLRFKFRGKSGKQHAIHVKDRKLAQAVKRISELPGQELFHYLDDEKNPHTVTSEDVNAYLREITGQDFTAKDFRTWAGTILAALALQEFEAFDSETQAKKNVMRAIETVAERLGNTPAICRKCYVHPEVLTAYMDGTLLDGLKQQTEQELKDGLDSLGSLQSDEAAVLAFLQSRLAREVEEQQA